MLLSRDEHDPLGQVSAKVVEAVFVRFAPILELRISGQLIRTSGEHPFYEWERGWVKANELHRGNTLLTLEGGWVSIEEVVESEKWERVYNLRIADFHTYFVGCQEWGFSVWAHNACLVRLDPVKDAAEIAANGGKTFKIVPTRGKPFYYGNVEEAITNYAAELGVGIDKLTIQGGVAKFKIGEVFSIAGPDFQKVKLALKEAGANKLVIDSGVVVEPKLDALLRKVAASGEEFQGVKVKLIGEQPSSIPGMEGVMRPIFEFELVP